MSEEFVTSSEWKEWNNQGFIPGPDETEAAFADRVAYCQNLEQHLIQKVGNHLPFKAGDKTSQASLQEVLPLTQEYYGISPQWVPLFFSNHQLAPWHGGCAWIFQLEEQTPTAAFLQLRAHFRTSSTYFLGMYHRRELIAHELAHVGRMLYQEPQFEEILAYQSSSSPWRRWFGPIVQSSKETLLFILVVGIVMMADFALLSLGQETAAWAVWWIRWIPFALIALALGRLMYRQRIFKKCLNHLEALYPPTQARHLLYRLRDREIQQFAYLSPNAIVDFMNTAQQHSFRWRWLITLYAPTPQVVITKKI